MFHSNCCQLLAQLLPMPQPQTCLLFSHTVMSDSATPCQDSVHHHLPELAQTHVHKVSDAIQPSHAAIPFSSHLQSFPEWGSFLMSQFLTQSKGFSRVFTNTTVQKHQFFGTQPSLWANSYIPTWLPEKP